MTQQDTFGTDTHLLYSSKLPKSLWGEAITHVVWLKNRTPTCMLPDGKMPYEVLYGLIPDLKGLHEWGCEVWVHTPGGSKLDGRATTGRWISFDGESNSHWIFWPEKHSVTVKHSVLFVNNNVVVASLPVAAPIQGESEGGTKNKDGEIKDIEEENMNHTKSAHLDMNQ